MTWEQSTFEAAFYTENGENIQTFNHKNAKSQNVESQHVRTKKNVSIECDNQKMELLGTLFYKRGQCHWACSLWSKNWSEMKSKQIISGNFILV